MWSEPWVRAVATSRARPELASQAEKARSSMGTVAMLMVLSCRAHKEVARNSDSIMLSRHNRAERRWVR